MPRINRIPGGYLDLIGAETQGRTPPDASDVVIPTVSLDDLYQSQTLFCRNVTVAHTARGAEASFVIPSGETWLLWSWSVVTTMALSTYYEEWNCNLRDLPRGENNLGSFPSIASSGVMSTPAANDRASYAISFPRPYPLTAGVEVRAYLEARDTAGVARTARHQYVISRLRF